MGGRYDVWLENLIMPEMAVRTSFNSPAGANKSPTKLEFCKRLSFLVSKYGDVFSMGRRRR
jgi:hypothetical protein